MRLQSILDLDHSPDRADGLQQLLVFVLEHGTAQGYTAPAQPSP